MIYPTFKKPQNSIPLKRTPSTKPVNPEPKSSQESLINTVTKRKRKRNPQLG